jgi:MFS family permease
MLVSVIGIVPLIFMEKRSGNMKGLVLSGISLLIMAELAFFAWGNEITGLIGALLLYFVAFNLLEAVLPSLVTRLAPASAKGTAMGIFASSQFFGAFSGGMFGGLAHQAFGLAGVFLLGAGVATLWLLVAVNMTNPRRLSNQMLRIGTLNAAQAEQLTAKLRTIPGIAEAVVIIEDGLAYLKIDKTVLDPAAIKDLTLNYTR